MKYKERDRIVAELRELADEVEAHGVELPSVYFTPRINFYLTVTDYVRNPETDEYEFVLNEEKTKANLRKFLDAVGTCEKDYKDDRIVVRKFYRSHPDRVMLEASIDRALACKKVVTGKKFVKEQLIPSRFEEEVEWVCDEGVSLLKLVQ